LSDTLISHYHQTSSKIPQHNIQLFAVQYLELKLLFSLSCSCDIFIGIVNISRLFLTSNKPEFFRHVIKADIPIKFRRMECEMDLISSLASTFFVVVAYREKCQRYQFLHQHKPLPTSYSFTVTGDNMLMLFNYQESRSCF